MRIAVVGTGYVGLVAGACFADAGTTVTCVDVDEKKLELLRAGNVPFFEPRLEELLKRNWPARLSFSSNLAESIDGRVAVFVAVGTPPNEDGSADLSHVLKVAEDVSACDRPYGDSPPSDIASYPFQPEGKDVKKIRKQLGIPNRLV